MSLWEFRDKGNGITEYIDPEKIWKVTKLPPRRNEDRGPDGDMLHFDCRPIDGSNRHEWYELQRIKNGVLGEECEAVELYPAESDVVDDVEAAKGLVPDVGIFHLWANKNGAKFDFGLRGGILRGSNP